MLLLGECGYLLKNSPADTVVQVERAVRQVAMSKRRGGDDDNVCVNSPPPRNPPGQIEDGKQERTC
jgi:hypothetical protein